jgi:hypothetical protein
MSKNGSIGLHTDNTGGGVLTQGICKITTQGVTTGVIKVKVEGSSAQSMFYNLDAGPEDATGIGFYLYHTDSNNPCDLYSPRFEAPAGGTAIKVEGTGGGINYGRINVVGGVITGCGTGVDLISAMNCTFTGTRFGRSVSGSFATIANNCWGTTFINCQSVTAAKDYMTDSGYYTTIINAGQYPYVALMPNVAMKNPRYRKSVSATPGVSSVYGTEATTSPASGFSDLIPLQVSMTVGGISGGETIRVAITLYLDNSTSVLVANKDFTTNSTFYLTNDMLIYFFRDGRQIRSIGVKSYSTGGTTSATTSAEFACLQY